MKFIIFFKILISISFFGYICNAQISSSLPGGADFTCRVLNIGLIPIPTLGLEGALRNPANYGTGITVNRHYFNGPIHHFVGLTGVHLDENQKIIVGATLNFKTYESSGRFGFGFHFEEYYDRTDSCYKTADNFVFGCGLGTKISKYVDLNIGFLRYIPGFKGILPSTFISLRRIDTAAEITFFNTISLTAVNRRLTFLGGYNFPHLSSKTEVSYSFHSKIENVNFGFFNKLLSEPKNLGVNKPFLFCQIYLINSLDIYDDLPLYNQGLLEGYLGLNGDFVLGLNIYGLTIQYGKNSQGENWMITWIIALFAGQ